MIKGPVCHPHGITGYGNPEHGIMIVGQNPAYNEMDTGLPFTGQDGEVLNGILKATGWDRSKVYCTNCCCVRDTSLIDECYPRLVQEIETFKPRLVITLGATACENLFHTKISRVRGALLYSSVGSHEFRGLATWLPSAILQAERPEDQNDYAAELVRDLRKIRRYFSAGRFPPTRVTVPYILVSNIQSAQNILDELPRDELVTIDIETPTIDKDAKEADPFHKILCVGIGLAGDIQYVFPEKIIGKLNWPKDVQWGGWNLYGFDMVGLRDKHGIELPIAHDGMLSSYVRDERTKYGTHKLKHNAREDAGADFYEEDEIRSSDSNLYRYNGYDVAYNHRILQYHLANFDEDDKRLYYELLIPAANMYSDTQFNGCKIDVFKLFDLTVDMMCIQDELEHDLVREAYANGWPELQDFNPQSSQQVGKFLFEILGIPPQEFSHPTKGAMKGGKFAWSVDKNVLDSIDHPWASKLRLHRSVADTKARYLDGVQSQVKHDGKVHPKVWLPGTTTGRPSISDPPVQQLPHRRTYKRVNAEWLARVREIFVPDSDDYILFAADYSQIELWILYGFSGDENLYADLTEPWSVTDKPDYHSRTCTHGVPCLEHLPLGIHAENCDVCIKWEFDRDNQKHVNFGIPYGETEYGLRRPPPIGTGLPLEVCRRLIQTWYKRNSDVLKWQKAIEYQLRTTGFIKTPSGRKRRFPVVTNPKQIREAINAPIQGTASDYTLTSSIELHPLVKEFDTRILWTTHDEILFNANRKYVYKNEQNQVVGPLADLVRHVMEKPRFEGFPSVKVEMKVGANLYEVSP
jgi:uracil-DNA glycosylase family 4